MSRDLKDLLEEKHYDTLIKILRNSKDYDAKHLFEASSKHADYALEKFKENPIVDFEAAEKLAAAIKEMQQRWSSIDEEAQNYLKGAMYYFAICEDDEADFDSFTGFDDDVAVLNACLKHAGLDDLVITLTR